MFALQNFNVYLFVTLKNPRRSSLPVLPLKFLSGAGG
jgi:hypothetical protein